MTEVLCPKCGTNRSINGTEKRVRCKNRECGARFYTLSNKFVPFPVPPITDHSTDAEGNIILDTTLSTKKGGIPKMSIGGLRSIYRQIFYVDPPHDSEYTKSKIIETIVVELEKL